MKRSLIALCLLLASGGPLFAAAAADGVLIRCDAIGLPSLPAVGAVTGAANAGEAYRMREVLLMRAQGLCKAPGVARVRFVPDSQAAVEPLRTIAGR